MVQVCIGAEVAEDLVGAILLGQEALVVVVVAARQAMVLRTAAAVD
jgi:hypothetical protein